MLPLLLLRYSIRWTNRDRNVGKLGYFFYYSLMRWSFLNKPVATFPAWVRSKHKQTGKKLYTRNAFLSSSIFSMKRRFFFLPSLFVFIFVLLLIRLIGVPVWTLLILCFAANSNFCWQIANGWFVCVCVFMHGNWSIQSLNQFLYLNWNCG